jgi:uncharacterized metal-binding protein YceD (DUF177 family)
VAGAETAGAVVLDAVVESRSTGVDLTGVLEVPWTAPCRRCLESVAGTTTIDVEEHFDHRPVSGEIGPIGEDGVIDLGPMIHDETRCALPLTVLCGSDCRGPVPDAFVDPDDPNAPTEPADPRWSALDELSFDD